MSRLDDFLATLDPKVAKAVKAANSAKIERLPLASYGLTEALGGGVARGHFALVYGNQSAGKTILMLETIALWQSMGLVCAYVDTEGVFDPEWAERLGVNVEDLILIQTRASGLIEKKLKPLIEAGVDGVFIDSISEIMPDVFVDSKTGELNDQENRKQIGAHARAITALLAGLGYLKDANGHRTAFVLSSQTTTEFGQTYVKQIPHGGKRTLFAMSQIIKITSSNTEAKQIKGEQYIGSKVFQTLIGRSVDGVVEKNKLGKQWTTCSYDVYYSGEDVGIDKVGEVVDEAIRFEIVVKGGAWFNFGDKKFQGRDALVRFFKSEPDELDKAIQSVAEVKADV